MNDLRAEAAHDFRMDVNRVEEAYWQTELHDYELTIPVTVEFDYSPPEKQTATSDGHLAEVEIKKIKLNGHDITEFLPAHILEAIRDYYGHGAAT